MRSRQVIAALIAAVGISAALSAQTIQIIGAGRPSPTRSTRSGSASNKLQSNVQINYQPLGSSAASAS